jgi:sulfoxide reductase heme-binding subunit YedZ
MIGGDRKGSHKRDLRAIHDDLSLTTLAMVALHGVSLLGDSYLNLGLTGIVIPFAGSYRPLWTGLGIVVGYGLAALGLTYYVRARIGAARWRRLHRLTAAFWALAIAHTIGAGRDAAQPWFLLAAGFVVVPAAVLLSLRRLDHWSSRGSARHPRAAPPPSTTSLIAQARSARASYLGEKGRAGSSRWRESVGAPASTAPARQLGRLRCQRPAGE